MYYRPVKIARLTLTCLGALVVILAAVCCSYRDADRNGSSVLAVVGKSQLTRAELTKALPLGLNGADSARYASAYIRRWVESRVISDLASAEIDMHDIDRMVNDYRNSLIEMEYRQRMADAHSVSEIPEDSLHNYYVANNSDFVLQRPMLQGVYLKVPDNARNIDVIRKLYRSDKQADIDRLEKEVLTSAIHYDFFRDKWVDWDQVESHIPYNFGSRPDEFLRGRDHFETTAGGFVYLLDIKDILPTGSIMPFESARSLIKERLNARKRRIYDAGLMDDLYNRSLKEGKIQLFVDLEP